MPSSGDRILSVLALLALGATVTPSSAAGQAFGTIRGTVKTADGTRVSGAQLRLSEPLTMAPPSGLPAAESDDNGVFSIARVPIGVQWLRVRRIGFRPDSVRVVLVDGGKVVDVPAVLERIAVDLAPVRVFGRRDLTGPMAGFYARMASGSGHFFTQADIQRRGANKMTDLLRSVPGIRIDSRFLTDKVRIRGSRCAPQIRLDGLSLSNVEFDLDAMDPMSFEGIEVYSGGSTVPIEFSANRDVSASCGTIVLWTRRGESTREFTRKKRDVTPAAQIARMLDELRVFAASDVDLAAQIDSATIVKPIYPDALVEAEIPGKVLVEFVVSTTGAMLMDTFSAVMTTNAAFVEPVRRALRDQRFRPAIRKGQAVQQVIQQLFEFVPDSTARRKR